MSVDVSGKTDRNDRMMLEMSTSTE